MTKSMSQFGDHLLWQKAMNGPAMRCRETFGLEVKPRKNHPMKELHILARILALATLAISVSSSTAADRGQHHLADDIRFAATRHDLVSGAPSTTPASRNRIGIADAGLRAEQSQRLFSGIGLPMVALVP
ncbi:MAG: hypothetical protein ABSF26_29510 [Thermoguttaceae bacterium]|jgi:hypothetical protein